MELRNNILYKISKYERFVNHVFCKLCKNVIYVKIVNYVKYGQILSATRRTCHEEPANIRTEFSNLGQALVDQRCEQIESNFVTCRGIDLL